MNKKNTTVIMASAIVAVLATAVLAHNVFAGGSNSASLEKNSNEKGKQDIKADQTGINQDAVADAHSSIHQNNNGGNGGEAK